MDGAAGDLVSRGRQQTGEEVACASRETGVSTGAEDEPGFGHAESGVSGPPGESVPQDQW